jgi:hypothetical protein
VLAALGKDSPEAQSHPESSIFLYTICFYEVFLPEVVN